MNPADSFSLYSVSSTIVPRYPLTIMDVPLGFSFHSLGRHRFPPGVRGNIPLTQHDGLTRSLVATEGIIRVEWGGRVHLLEPGLVLNLAAEQSVNLACAEQTGAVCVELLFGGAQSVEYATHLYSNYSDVISVENWAAVISSLRLLERCARAEGRLSLMQETRLVFRWFLMLHRSARMRRENLGAFLKEGRERLMAVAGEHRFSLAALAQSFGCSPSHLATQLQHVLGMPAGRFLREARWDRALQLMGSTRLHLGDIARKCGYDSSAAFHFAFRKRFGETPGSYRRRPSPRLLACEANSAPVVEPEMKSSVLPKAEEPIPESAAVDGSLNARRLNTKPAVIQDGPYYHFDGGEVAYPFAKPFRFSIQTLSNAMQWVMTLEGRSVFEVGGHRIEVAPGTVLLFPQPINASWVSPDDQPWRRVWIKMRGEWAVQTMERFVDTHGWRVQIPLRSRPVMLARKWVSFWHKESGRLSLDGCEAAFEWFLSWRDLMERGQVKTLPTPDMKTFSSKQFFRRIKSITSYAQKVGYSRAHLSRKLKYQWIETPQPGTFLRKQKLAWAAQELRSTNLPVSEIARRAHYAHTSTFIQAFRREYGTSPLQYRLHA